MGCINPLASQLSEAKGQIKDLEKENPSLRLQRARLRGQDVTSKLPTPSSSSSASPERSITSERSLPSYARSTISSRTRSSEAPSSQSRDTLPSTHQSTSPTTTPTKRANINCRWGHFGYMQHTEASLSRLRINHWSRAGLGDATDSSFDGKWDANPRGWGYSKQPKDDADNPRQEPVCTWDEYPSRPKNFTPANRLCIMSETEWDDVVTKTDMAVRTRLRDNSWTRAPEYKVYIDHDVLFDIGREGEAVAKLCFWNFLRRHRSHICPGSFDYKSDIDFGRDSLSAWFYSHHFNFRHTTRFEVTSQLVRLVRLRNFVHHFNGHNYPVAHMDWHLRAVHELAVLLYDGAAARRARELRDRLRGEAEATAGEIESLLLWKSLPEAGEQAWKPHHIDLIRDAPQHQVLGVDPGRLRHAPVAVAAAREWASRWWGWDVVVSQPEAQAETPCGGSLTDHGRGLGDFLGGDGDMSGVVEDAGRSHGSRRRHSLSLATRCEVDGAGGRTRRHSVSTFCRV